MDALAAATLERLTYLHDSMKSALAALPDAALDWSPAAEVNSVAVLITHVAGSERFWFGEKVGGIAAAPRAFGRIHRQRHRPRGVDCPP